MIIEVYGIAGSGKSTWVKQQNDMTKVKVSLWIKMRVLVRLITRDLAPFLRLTFCFKNKKKRRIIFFIFYKLNAAELLTKIKKQKLVYDQGPIYNVSRLLYVNNNEKDELFACGLKKLLKRIRLVYDETVYLRCPVDIALVRIRTRDKVHFAQFIGEEEAKQRLEQWQSSYEFIREQLQSTVIENY